MKSILITGSDGFVGKNLINFYKTKYNILTLNRKTNINEVLKLKPNFIINSAANIYEENGMFDSNVVLVNTLLNYVKDTGSRMIQIGSSAEYGKKSHASKETDFLEPRNMYEATKAAASMLCVGIAKQYNLPVAVARPYSVYGNYEKDYRLFPKLLNAFTKNVSMTLNQGYHDFIYIKDFVRGLDTLIHEDANKMSGDVVNFGSGIQTSNFEVLDEFVNIFGYMPDCIQKQENFAKSFETNIWVCDTEYAHRKYNFFIDYNLQNGIIDFIKDKNENSADN